MINNYIFDLYGTLLHIHTDEEKASLWMYMTRFYKRKPEELKNLYKRYCKEEFERQKACMNTNDPEIDILHVFEKMHPMHSIDVKHIATQFRNKSREILELYTDTMDTLSSLKRQGKKIYLLSNAQEAFTLDELDQMGLTHLFDGICISSNYGIKKPDVRFMNYLLNTYQLRIDESVMIGNDFSTDIAIANKVGMKAIHINTDHYSKEYIKNQKYVFEEIETLRQLL